MFRWTGLRWWLLLAVIVGGHVALWLSPRTSDDAALRLTLTNAAIWAVVLLPALGVNMWARTHRRLASAGGPDQDASPEGDGGSSR